VVRGLSAVLVEAFSEEPLGGNGASVVLLQEPASTDWMRRLAGSLKQSETAFLLATRGGWALRWFTPRQEVPLCGHATLAALLALDHWGLLPEAGETVFFTRSGPLAVRLLPQADPQAPHNPPLGQLELPRLPLEPTPPPAALVRLLRERLQVAAEGFWHSPLGYQVALLPPGAPLAQPQGMAEALVGPTRSGLVLMQSLPREAEGRPWVAGLAADYQLRFFAPGLGIDEDPVTGSAHALVAPFWMDTLQRSRVVGWQCSDRPGGMVCEEGSSGMIRLTGSGHLLWEGTLRAEPEPSGGPWPAGDPRPSPAPSQASAEWEGACAVSGFRCSAIPS
jgi:predicted PhzF superfamily epimerase YddE/YHI9